MVLLGHHNCWPRRRLRGDCRAGLPRRCRAAVEPSRSPADCGPCCSHRPDSPRRHGYLHTATAHVTSRPGAAFMKHLRLTNLHFLTSAGNKYIHWRLLLQPKMVGSHIAYKQDSAAIALRITYLSISGIDNCCQTHWSRHTIGAFFK